MDTRRRKVVDTMRKYKCNCAACEAAIAAQFFGIVDNPANGQWLASMDVNDATLTLQERLVAMNAAKQAQPQ